MVEVTVSGPEGRALQNAARLVGSTAEMLGARQVKARRGKGIVVFEIEGLSDTGVRELQRVLKTITEGVNAAVKGKGSDTRRKRPSVLRPPVTEDHWRVARARDNGKAQRR